MEDREIEEWLMGRDGKIIIEIEGGGREGGRNRETEDGEMDRLRRDGEMDMEGWRYRGMEK